MWTLRGNRKKHAPEVCRAGTNGAYIVDIGQSANLY